LYYDNATPIKRPTHLGVLRFSKRGAFLRGGLDLLIFAKVPWPGDNEVIFFLLSSLSQAVIFLTTTRQMYLVNSLAQMHNKELASLAFTLSIKCYT